MVDESAPANNPPTDGLSPEERERLAGVKTMAADMQAQQPEPRPDGPPPEFFALIRQSRFDEAAALLTVDGIEPIGSTEGDSSPGDGSESLLAKKSLVRDSDALEPIPSGAQLYAYLTRYALRAMADAGHIQLPASSIPIEALLNHPHVKPYLERFAALYDPDDPRWDSLIRAWYAEPTTVEPYRPTQRASLPRLHRIDDDTRLPDFPTSADAPSRQMDLPGFAPTVTTCPSWLLWLYDRAGGESMAQGRGAPWSMRLFVGALLHLPVHSRDGEWRTLRFPTDEVIAWLHPDGWANRRRDWDKFPAALDAMRERLSYVPVPGLGSVAMLVPSIIPRSPNNPLVEFTIRIPTIAAQGASIDWPTLCEYGNKSAALYRAYLSAVAFMDRSAHNGHGITAEIGAPVLNAKGSPRRRKSGELVRSKGRTIPNKAARYVKALDDKDLTRMIGFDAEVKQRRLDARKAFERLHADKVIDLQRNSQGYRIFKPRLSVSF